MQGLDLGGEVERLIGESAVVILSVSNCCMCHAIKRLLCGMGVNPTVHELSNDILIQLGGPITSSLPLVFIGGQLLGAIDTLMASHINGTLVPLLKNAGALWL